MPVSFIMSKNVEHSSEKTVRPEAGVKTDLEIAQSNCDACKS